MSEKWEDGLDPKPERLEDQRDIDVALEKLRRGVRLTAIKYSRMPELFELKVVKSPDGEDREVIFVYDYEEGLPLSNADTVESWREDYIHCAGISHFDLDYEEALKYLKEGHRVENALTVYFKGTVQGNMPGLEDTEFVFCVSRTKRDSLAKHMVMRCPLDDFEFDEDMFYGLDD